MDDDVSFGRNLELLKAEMSKQKPRSDVLKEYMRRTFPNRWQRYTNPDNPEPASLNLYIMEYPFLKKLSFVS